MLRILAARLMEVVFRAALWQLRQVDGVDGANETAVAVCIAESVVDSCSRESELRADNTSRMHSVCTQTEDPGTSNTTADATAQTGPQAERPTATVRPFNPPPQPSTSTGRAMSPPRPEPSTSTGRAMPPPRPEILRQPTPEEIIYIPAGYESDEYLDSDYDYDYDYDDLSEVI